MLFFVQTPNIEVNKESFGDTESVTVTCKVSNTGSRRGKEVVQLYVADHESRLKRPKQELKAFAKIELGPGETKSVSFALVARDFSYYDPAPGRWVAESGRFDIMIGKSSREICLRKTVELESAQNNLPPLTRESYMKDVLDNPVARRVFKDFLIQSALIKSDGADEMMEGLRALFLPIGKAMQVYAVPGATLDELLERINKEASRQ